MTTYSIKDWSGTFVVNRSKELKNPSWVPFPVALSSRAYRRLVRDECGVAAYGVFVALVVVALRCQPQGSLVRDDGSPMDLIDLEGATGMASNTIERSLEILSSKAIGWLVASPPHEGAGLVRDECGDGAASRTRARASDARQEETRGEETRGEETVHQQIEVKPRSRVSYPADFETFWSTYPRKVGKGEAAKAWSKLERADRASAIDAVKLQSANGAQLDLKTRVGQNGDSKVPHAATWLRGQRWDDEVDIQDRETQRMTEAQAFIERGRQLDEEEALRNGQ